MRYYATTIRHEQLFAPWFVHTFTFLLVLTLAAGQLFAAPAPAPTVSDDDAAAATRYGELPLHFTPNEGQADAAVKYTARGNGYNILLTADEAVLVLRGAEAAVLRMQLQGANPTPVVEGASPLPGRVHYLSGSPSAWITNLSTFGEVHYKDVYPGVDVVYYGTDRQRLEYDFVVQPGVSPEVIRFRLDGADAMTLDEAGNLVLTVNGQDVTQLAPFSYQTIGGVQVPVASRYVLDGDAIAFEVGPYDAGRVLVIDPVIEYSTYLGGAGADEARAITVDIANNAYVTGCTDNTGGSIFPAGMPGAAPTGAQGAKDVFVTKLDPTGTAQVWSTFIAGTKDECGEGIAVNDAGEVFVAGWTASKESNLFNQFPIVNDGDLDATHDGNVADANNPYDGFVAKLAADGSAILWSGFLGGEGLDRAWDIAIDADGDVYVTGETWSGTGMEVTGFGTSSDNGHNGNVDAFIVKLTDGVSPTIAHASYLGGSANDIGYSVAVNDSEEAYIAGSTTSSAGTFPLANAFDATFGGGQEAFFAKFSAAGTARLVSSYLGGSGIETAWGIAVNAADQAHVVGATTSTDFSAITTGSLHDAPLGAADGFAVKMKANGNQVEYGTYIGGAGNNDDVRGVAVDAWDRAHIVGFTNNGITTASPTQGASGGQVDAFVKRLSSDGASLVFATYLGGGDDDYALDVAVDADESTYVAGYSTSSDFPVGTFVAGLGFGNTVNHPDAFQESFGGSTDAFVTKYGVSADLAIEKSVMTNLYSPLVGQEIVYEIEVTNNGPDDISRFVVTDDLPAGVVFVSADGCNGPTTSLPAVGTRGVVTCDVQQGLDSGESYTIRIKVEVRAVTPIENCASVADNTNDPDLANNTACTTITPQPQVNFWLPANQDAATATAFVSIPKGSGSFGTTFVGTDGGGVYRTTDMGANWYPTNLIDVNVRGLARSTGNGAIYAATYGDGLYRTQDVNGNGGNFDEIDFVQLVAVGLTTDNLLSLAINNFNPNNSGSTDHDIWVGTDGAGVFYANNNGTAFAQVNTGLGNLVVRSLAIGEATAGNGEDRVFAGTHGRGVYYMDYNGGNTITGNWVEANGDVMATPGASLDRAVVHALAVDGSGTGAVVYAGTNDGVYRGTWDGSQYLWEHVLTDGAASWEDAPVVRSLLVYECNGEEYLMAGTDGQYVYRILTDDLDDGTPYTWERFTGLAATDNTASGLQSATVLALHFTDWDEKLYAGTQDEGVHLSTDCGETFEQITNTSLQDAYRVIQALQFDYDSADRNRLFGGTFGFGVIMSDDLSNPQAPPILNWTSTNHGLTNQWVYAFALKESGLNDYLFAGTWGGGVFRSTDDAETWQFSGLANRIVYDLALGADGTLYEGVLYAATDRGEVSRSKDNGLTWQEIGVATTAIWALGIDPDGNGSTMNAGDVYAGTFGAGIYKSVDGGFTWTQTNLTSGHIFDFEFGTHPEVGDYAVFAATATGVKYSTDGGETWSDFTTVGLTTPDVRALELLDLDPNNAGGEELLAGTWGGGVFRYDDDSDAWIRDGLPGHAIALFAVHPQSGEVFVATDGGVFRKTFAAGSSVDAEEGWTEVPTAYSLGQNYPNPFNPATQVEFALPEASQVRLTVFDALGRQVQVLVDGQLSAGTHEVTFEARDLPSGVYFYRLETPKQAITKSMILMK